LYIKNNNKTKNNVKPKKKSPALERTKERKNSYESEKNLFVSFAHIF